MLLCNQHTAQLRAALDARGLGPLISDDQVELQRRLSRKNQEGLTHDSFDPMFEAEWNILNNCAQVATSNGELGLHRMLGCHFCFCKSRWPQASVYSSWMNAAADGMLKTYRRLVSGSA